MAIRSPLSFGHAPDGADTSSDPPLAGHLLLKEKALGGVLGTASTVGAASGRPLFCRGNDFLPTGEGVTALAVTDEGPLRPVCALGTSPRRGRQVCFVGGESVLF